MKQVIGFVNEKQYKGEPNKAVNDALNHYR